MKNAPAINPAPVLISHQFTFIPLTGLLILTNTDFPDARKRMVKQEVYVKVYLDVCCLCRPFDDQTINRIHLEAEAIKEILMRCMQDWTLVTSDAVSFEISRIPDRTRMKKAQNLMNLATEHGAITKPVSRRYHEFVETGIDSADALHPACAESAGATLLTTDDTIIKV